MHMAPLHPGYVTLSQPPAELAEHGLAHAANTEFYTALLEVVDLLRAESLLRECHAIHAKLVDLADCIRSNACQDYVPPLYPAHL